MGLKKIYKNGEEKSLNWSAANELVVNDGWSWTKEPTVAMKAVKKSAKPKTKVKVEVQADVKVDSPFNDGNPINKDDQDIININKEK